jgi:drug/metabolite transporter (DMT)-like permease
VTAPAATEPALGLGIGPLDWFAKRPRLAALIGAICISFSGIFYLNASVSASTGTVFRALFGLPLLVLVALAERRRSGPLPTRTVRLSAIAGLFFVGDLMTWHLAIAAVGAGLATVLGNLQVLIVGFIAWIALGEKPSRNTLIALPIVLTGVVFISGVIGSGAYGANPALGVALGIACAFFYAGYLLTIRLGGRDQSRPAGPVATSTFVTFLGAMAVGVVGGNLNLTPSPSSLFWLVLYGLTSQSLGYLLISISLPRLPAVIVSVILLAQPVITVGLARVLLGETPSAAQTLGVGLVIGGIAIATVPIGRLRGVLRRDPAGDLG